MTGYNKKQFMFNKQTLVGIQHAKIWKESIMLYKRIPIGIQHKNMKRKQRGNIIKMAIRYVIKN